LTNGWTVGAAGDFTSTNAFNSFVDWVPRTMGKRDLSFTFPLAYIGSEAGIGGMSDVTVSLGESRFRTSEWVPVIRAALLVMVAVSVFLAALRIVRGAAP
jgi:hypothetical protein